MADSALINTWLRWFNRVVIEGERASARARDSDDEQSSGDDTDAEESRTGATYRVGAGKVRLLSRGMEQYVTSVEKRLRKDATPV